MKTAPCAARRACSCLCDTRAAESRLPAETLPSREVGLGLARGEGDPTTRGRPYADQGSVGTPRACQAGRPEVQGWGVSAGSRGVRTGPLTGCGGKTQTRRGGLRTAGGNTGERQDLGRAGREAASDQTRTHRPHTKRQ